MYKLVNINRKKREVNLKNLREKREERRKKKKKRKEEWRKGGEISY